MLYDKILNYGKFIKQYGSVATPKDIIKGFLSPMDVLGLKKGLSANNITVLEQTETTKACIILIKNSECEEELMYYTLRYIGLRNPLVVETIKGILKGL